MGKKLTRQVNSGIRHGEIGEPAGAFRDQTWGNRGPCKGNSGIRHEEIGDQAGTFRDQT